MGRIAILLALCGSVFGAESQADTAVLAMLRQSDAKLINFKILHRDAVTEDLDMVLAIGGTKEWSVVGGPLVTWAEKQKLGLFLQEKNQPGRVYQLAVDAGPGNCTLRIDRVTSTDTVVVCTKDDAQSTPLNHKFVYDVRSKRLVSQFSYSPFAMLRGFPNAGGAVFVASDSQRLISVAFQPGDDSPFRVLDQAEARPWLARIRTSEGAVGLERKRFLYIEPDEFKPVRFGAFVLDQEAGNSFGPRLVITEPRGTQTLHYELPQSTYDDFAAARPPRVNNNYVRANTEFDERIGPWQIEDGKLWFGKTFYDGEGTTGVGGSGYFDPADRKFHIFAPPEIADWSVSAILVEPDAVWTTLICRGEYGGPSGGVLRFDRQSETVRRFEVPDSGVQILRVGDALLVATSGGITVIDGDQVTRYFVDQTADGGLRVAQATR